MVNTGASLTRTSAQPRPTLLAELMLELPHLVLGTVRAEESHGDYVYALSHVLRRSLSVMLGVTEGTRRACCGC